MYRGGSTAEMGQVDRERINDALDKHLERSSPSSSRVGINGKDKDRSLSTASAALSTELPSDLGVSRSASSFHDKALKALKKKQTGRVKYRCSIILLKKQVKTLEFRGDHIRALKKTPFWKLIQAIIEDKIVDNHCSVDNSVMSMIVNCYVKGDRSFLFGKKDMQLKPRHAKLLLGINDGEEEININYYSIDRSEFLVRHFPERVSTKSKDYKLSPTIVSNQIQAIIASQDQRDVNDVASLTTLLVLASFLVPTTSSYIPWAYTNIISDLDNISKYNWSKHIVERLIEDLETRKDDNIEKCVLLLPYWLCERSTILKRIKGDDIPRFLKWDLSALSRQLNRSNFSSVMKNQKFHYFPKATRSEKDVFSGIGRNENEEMCPDLNADLRIEGCEFNNGAIHQSLVDTDLFDVRINDTQPIENTCCKSLKDELMNKEKMVQELRSEINIVRTELLAEQRIVKRLWTDLIEEKQQLQKLRTELAEKESTIGVHAMEVETLKSELAKSVHGRVDRKRKTRGG